MIPRNPQPREIFSKPAGKPLNRAVHAALLGMALSLPFGTALIAQPASAQTNIESSFDIPAGALGSALTQFAAAAGVTVSFDPAHAAGQQTSGLRGRYSTDA
ncbi:hypothetical protein ACNPOQ_24280, partial [Pseudomonas shirazensis]